jgi:hypothetical protein
MHACVGGGKPTDSGGLLSFQLDYLSNQISRVTGGEMVFFFRSYRFDRRFSGGVGIVISAYPLIICHKQITFTELNQAFI